MEPFSDSDEDNSDEVNRFSTQSITLTASSIGIENLSKKVRQLIADELTFKMRELIYKAKFIMSRNKRTKLTNDDVDKAMKLLGGCEIFGHDTKEPSSFIQIPELDLYVEEDEEIDVVEAALEESIYEQRPEPYIQGTWLLPEGHVEEPLSSAENSKYFCLFAKTIMTGSPSHLRVVLNDLRTNPKIGPLCPHFLNLVAHLASNTPVVSLGHPVASPGTTVNQKPARDVNLSNTLISVVHAIAHNRYVDPSPYFAVNRAVVSLLNIVIETNETTACDDLAVRYRAGHLLAKVVKTWTIQLRQQMGIVRRLLQHLLDPGRPLQSHYGAIVALTALGQLTYDFHFWPVIERYVPQLEQRCSYRKKTEKPPPEQSTKEQPPPTTQPSSDIPDDMELHVMTALLVAARSTHQKEPTSLEQLEKLYRVDQMLYDMFGDSVTPLRVTLSAAGSTEVPKPAPPAHDKSPGSSSLPRAKHRLAIYVTRWSRPQIVSSDVETPTRRPLPYEPAKVLYGHVLRNPKLTRQLHKNSASGDLNLVL
ncbi:TAF6-like RNA polymerase II, p300 CBP-associated factor (PCAF)-associated factor [Nesidiocoris tenuis]|uniref:TAF6-like RNA polymerase II, p300 CBP-associated factor (PCAF)-associated factor n=1 Tax=Nesidiocoris tenuis TaxID=355587 RepID=A0ABN7A981_9HEMI|nr:TAF6-like RNA polymerase II, p300 CBP-associated factor (PCAF)-associated factor [Nesidiocoris tenuis]